MTHVISERKNGLATLDDCTQVSPATRGATRTKTSGLDCAPTGEVHSVKAIDLEFSTSFLNSLVRVYTVCLRIVARWGLFYPLSQAIHRAHCDDRIALSAPARESYKWRESYCVYRQV